MITGMSTQTFTCTNKVSDNAQSSLAAMSIQVAILVRHVKSATNLDLYDGLQDNASLDCMNAMYAIAITALDRNTRFDTHTQRQITPNTIYSSPCCVRLTSEVADGTEDAFGALVFCSRVITEMKVRS